MIPNEHNQTVENFVCVDEFHEEKYTGARMTQHQAFIDRDVDMDDSIIESNAVTMTTCPNWQRTYTFNLAVGMTLIGTNLGGMGVIAGFASRRRSSACKKQLDAIEKSCA